MPQRAVALIALFVLTLSTHAPASEIVSGIVPANSTNQIYLNSENAAPGETEELAVVIRPLDEVQCDLGVEGELTGAYATENSTTEVSLPVGVSLELTSGAEGDCIWFVVRE